MVGINALLFDLDGTLIDTTDLILRCFDHAWQQVCGITHARESVVATFGMPLRAAMHKLLRTGEATIADDPEIVATAAAARIEAQVELLLTTYRRFNVANHDHIARPFAGTQEVIASLRTRGYAIGVVTSKSRELAQRGLRLCALEDLIDEAVYLEDTTRHKPAPEPILTALGRLQMTARQAVYIGDSFHDIIAGRAAGVKTVAAAWGPMPRATLERENPDLIAESITDLLSMFP